MRNAIRNTATNPEEFRNDGEVFIALADRFTALHIHALQFFAVGRRGTVGQFPFLRDIQLADSAAGDLAHSGLIVPKVELRQRGMIRKSTTAQGQVDLKYTYFYSLQTMADPEPTDYIASANLTDLGRRFHRFLASPPE